MNVKHSDLVLLSITQHPVANWLQISKIYTSHCPCAITIQSSAYPNAAANQAGYLYNNNNNNNNNKNNYETA